jgi:hypothetical protein
MVFKANAAVAALFFLRVELFTVLAYLKAP